MPPVPIIDTHLHLWNPAQLPYSWLKGNERLNRPYLASDYRTATVGTDVAAMVFVECDVDDGFCEREVRLVEEEARGDSRIKGLIAQARLEEGSAVLPFLEHLRATTPLLRGIRRIIESFSDAEACLQPGFVEGVRLVGALGLSFEMTVNFRQMETILKLVDGVGDVPLMLDHCGKPGIRERRLELWRGQIRALAGHSSVRCKVSGLITEADHRRWSEDDIRPYIDTVIEAFGFERLVFGGDWPVCLQAGSFSEWVALVDRVLAGVTRDAQKAFWRNNAIDFYRLDVSRL